LREACENLISNLPANSTVLVSAVTPENTGLSAFVTDEIIRNLVNSGRLKVVDNSKLRDELDSLYNGWYAEDGSSIERMLVPDIVISGSISGSGSSQNLRLRATDTETARVSAMVSVQFK
jgi:TolB-like protein